MQPLSIPTSLLTISLCAAALCFSSCAGNPSGKGQTAWASAVTMPDVAVAQAPFDQVEVKWKERFREPYVYIENRGDYRNVGHRIADLMQITAAQTVPVSGAPFVLFFDDPGKTPQNELYSRICLGIDDEFMARPPLLVDELSQELVVYAAIGGAYSEVPRAYPKLLERISQLSGVITGPIREAYLVSPVGAEPWSLVTEVQIPWGPQR
ncbi:MAG: effector-binding domain-containing protein [Planctomycetota bacterium]|jgi:effector-binding domain-containing protein